MDITQWARAEPNRRGGGRVVWHVVTGVHHFRDEYKDGCIIEGDDVRTFCYPGGYNLIENVKMVSSNQPPGKVCKVCSRKLAKLVRCECAV